MSYLTEGTGPRTALLIHGSGMSARSWVNQLHGRPDTLRMIAVDLPGHGESDPTPAESVEEYAAVVGDVLAALECGPVVVVGHSLGGSIAIALAAQRPALVRGLVLIASCLRLPLIDSVGERLVAYLPGPLRRLLFFSMARRVLFAPDAAADAIATAMRDLRACRPETLAADVRAARAMDLTEAAAGLDVPTLVLAGERDRLTSPALAERLSALIRRSRLAIVPGVGHMLPLEAPERVNREIAAFVESLAEPSSAPPAIAARPPSLARRACEWFTRLTRAEHTRRD
ncbi:MAG TPA: alpha/beta hydrolase [Methylomirabilota bacterium]